MSSHYTVCEAAKKLNCHPNTVKRLEKRLNLRIKRDYRNYRIFSLEDIQKIEEFINKEY